MQCYHIICLSIGHLLLTDRIAQLVLSRRQFVDSKRDERQGGWQCWKETRYIALTQMSILPVDSC
jgi:hypothetical protein